MSLLEAVGLGLWGQHRYHIKECERVLLAPCLLLGKMLDLLFFNHLNLGEQMCAEESFPAINIMPFKYGMVAEALA